jgi:hypothetical protein
MGDITKRDPIDRAGRASDDSERHNLARVVATVEQLGERHLCNAHSNVALKIRWKVGVNQLKLNGFICGCIDRIGQPTFTICRWRTRVGLRHD